MPCVSFMSLIFSPDKEDRESSLEKQRLEDIELLHQLGVTYINDLMVENRKVK